MSRLRRRSTLDRTLHPTSCLQLDPAPRGQVRIMPPEVPPSRSQPSKAEMTFGRPCPFLVRLTLAAIKELLCFVAGKKLSPELLGEAPLIIRRPPPVHRVTLISESATCSAATQYAPFHIRVLPMQGVTRRADFARGALACLRRESGWHSLSW